MSEPDQFSVPVDVDDLRAYLCELSELLLSWSWEGVVGCEAIVAKAATAFGHEMETVVFEAEAASLQLGGKLLMVKVDMPGFPPLASTQYLKNHLADVFDGKLSVAEARAALRDLRKAKPPYSAFVVWLGVILLSASFSVDIVGTWEGIVYACLTATVTGIIFLAADRIKGFGKVAPMIGGFASGVIVLLGWKFGMTATAPGLLLIASTFVFIPGDSISMQAYELAEGRWSAAVDRFFYSAFMLFLLVSGAFFATVVVNVPVEQLMPTGPVGNTFPWWAVYPGHVFLLIGIMFTFQMDFAHFGKALALLMISTAIAQAVSVTWNEVFGTLVAAMVCTIISLWLARGPRSIPSFVLMVPVVFALSPGSHGVREVETWVSQETITGVTDVWSLIGILMAIAVGIMLGSMIARRHWLSNWA